MALTSLTVLFTALALYTNITLVTSAVQFIWLHFIHKSQIKQYLNSDASTKSGAWALVTGASDGIGFGFVQELAADGFNVILHGRNKTKLEGLISQVRKQYPAQQFRTFVSDASQRDDWQDKFAEFIPELKVSEINLKVLVNNVGGTGGSFLAFDKMIERDRAAIMKAIDVNATFPTALTHALLPLLVQNKPALIINIGSVVAAFPPPYLGPYAGSKAFNMAWSDSLNSEMRIEKTELEVLGVFVGRVINAASKNKVGSLFAPTARDFARATLQKVGCRIPSVTTYWPHDVQMMAVRLTPSWVVRRVLADMAAKEMAEERRGR